MLEKASHSSSSGYWLVQEILDEFGGKYKVAWTGTNPDTGKPWPPSWVLKSDCTADLVARWHAREKVVSKTEPTLGSGKTNGSSDPAHDPRAKRKRQSNSVPHSPEEPEDHVEPKFKKPVVDGCSSPIKAGPPRGARKNRVGFPRPPSSGADPGRFSPEQQHPMSTFPISRHLNSPTLPVARPQERETQEITAPRYSQPEHQLMPANSTVVDDLPGIVAKMEKIKRLQCSISINCNEALRYSMEVIEALKECQTS